MNFYNNNQTEDFFVEDPPIGEDYGGYKMKDKFIKACVEKIFNKENL